MRATSIATLPLPITTARLALRSNSWSRGAGGRCTKRRSWSPGAIPRGPRLRCRDGCRSGADRVDDDVVTLEQLGAGDVLAERDAAEEAEVLVRGGLLIDARHVLDLRVVRGDAEADEAERRRQLVDQVDVKSCVQQLAGGVEAGRTGADDGSASGHGVRVPGASRAGIHRAATGSARRPRPRRWRRPQPSRPRSSLPRRALGAPGDEVKSAGDADRPERGQVVGQRGEQRVTREASAAGVGQASRPGHPGQRRDRLRSSPRRCWGAGAVSIRWCGCSD